MDASCVDNRWTASLCMWPPGCSPLVPLPSQEVGGAWASLSLAGCKHKQRRVSEKPTALAGHLKIWTQGLSSNTLTCHCYQWLCSTYSTPHTMWGCAVELASALTVATILADATVTPTVSKMTYNVLSGMLNHNQPTNKIENKSWHSESYFPRLTFPAGRIRMRLPGRSTSSLQATTRTPSIRLPGVAPTSARHTDYSEHTAVTEQ